MTTVGFKTFLFALLVLLVFVSFYLKSIVFPPQYFFEISSSANETKRSSFPLEAPLPVIMGGEALGAGKKTVSMKELLERYPGGVLINFWATWCPTCIEEIPSLDYFYRRLILNKDPKLPLLVTLSVDESIDDVRSLYETLFSKPVFPVLYDRQGVIANSLGTSKYPETYWVGSGGTILHKWVGPQNWLSQEVLSKFKLYVQP